MVSVDSSAVKLPAEVSSTPLALPLVPMDDAWFQPRFKLAGAATVPSCTIELTPKVRLPKAAPLLVTLPMDRSSAMLAVKIGSVPERSRSALAVSSPALL